MAAKCDGNYATSLAAQVEAYEHSCDQVLYLSGTGLGNLRERCADGSVTEIFAARRKTAGPRQDLTQRRRVSLRVGPRSRLTIRGPWEGRACPAVPD